MTKRVTSAMSSFTDASGKKPVRAESNGSAPLVYCLCIPVKIKTIGASDYPETWLRLIGPRRTNDLPSSPNGQNLDHRANKFGQ